MENTKQINIYCIRKSGKEVWAEYKSVMRIHTELGLNRVKLKEAFDGKKQLSGYETKVKITYKPLSSSDIWKAKNPERAKENTNYHNSKRDTLTGDTTTVTCARIYGSTDEWQSFPTQSSAAIVFDVSSPNISHVISGKISHTGGYEFKKETILKQQPKPVTKMWKDICLEKGYENASIGKVSPHRIIHSTKDDMIGKICCTCKTWKSLTTYNASSTHWDELRNDCTVCLSTYRSGNKSRMTEYNKVYWINTKDEQTAKHKIWTIKNNQWSIQTNEFSGTG